MHLDITRISALVDKTERVMTEEEAATMTGYLRCLGAILRDRSKKSPGAGKSWEELIELAKQIPELREALGGCE